VKAGTAVFFVKGGSKVAPMVVPQCAIQTLDTGDKIPVVVIQAEIAPYGVILGVRPLSGGSGICEAREITLLPDGFGSILPPNNAVERTQER
jgi:hypothetical protein